MGKLVIEIKSGDTRIVAELPGDPEICLPLLLHSRVRVEGTTESEFAADGTASQTSLRVDRKNQVTIVQPAFKYWSSYSRRVAADLGDAPNGEIVFIKGEVISGTDTRSITIKTDSLEVLVGLAQPFTGATGAEVEIIGKCEMTAGTWKIAGAIWSPASRPEESGTTAVLETTQQVHALRPEAADAQLPVRICGVVTSRDENGGMVQDATRGVYVHGLKRCEQSGEINAGDFVEVSGTTLRGTFAPMIACRAARKLGRGVLPQPIQPTWERLNNGSLDCQYVEIEGFVTQAYENSLVLLMPEGHFGIAIVPSPGVAARSYRLQSFANQNVRIRGTVFATRNNETHQVKAGSIGLGNPLIGLGEPLATLDKSAAELLQFDARAVGLHQVRVRGQILHARERDYYLNDEGHTLRFVTQFPAQLAAGDHVEVVGFPRIGGSAPVLLDASTRKLASGKLPAGMFVSADELRNKKHVGTLVEIEGRLMGVRSNRSEIIFDLQAGPRSLVGRLDRGKGEIVAPPVGSLLRVQGVYTGPGRDPVTRAETDSCELLLNQISDLRVVELPSWWTPARAVTAISSLLGVLLLGAAWVVSLQRRVETRTAELRGEIEQRKRMQAEVERVHTKLVDASRKAGMAQIATGVLHNVGNVLNSVNVSANILSENTRHSRVQSLSQLADILEEHHHDLPAFIGSDPRGQRIPRLVRNLAKHFSQEQELQLNELEELKKHVEHVKETVAMQQNYARDSSTFYELTSLVEVVEDALRLQAAAFVRHEISVTRHYVPVEPFLMDRHKVLQILVNLLGNGREACDQQTQGSKRIAVRIAAPSPGQVRVEIEDSGIGIAPENLQKIFSYGFTTRAKGHGYGLHSSANAAAEMRSTLAVQSDGIGKGATFILNIPCLTTAETPVLANA